MNLPVAIKQAGQGNTAAQKFLYEQLSGRMMMLCRRYIKSPEDAEEILLDGFCKVYNSLSAFIYHSDAAFYGWVKRIMLNECLGYLRKKNIFTIVPEAVAEEIPVEESVLNKLDAAELFTVITQLPVGYRTVFNLFEVEGLEHKEIAALLQITEGTSRSQLSKAKTLLQKMLTGNAVDYAKRRTQ